MKTETKSLKIFEKYLSIWVLLCMGVGLLIGRTFPAFPLWMNQMSVANVNLPIALLIWLMIFPMMLKIDFGAIKGVRENPKGLYLTWVVNWLIKPFTMFLLASLFFSVVFRAWIPGSLARDYLAGAVLLGAAPCTAMVFVWSDLTRGNPAYTLVQVATNDLIILIAFVPLVGLLLGIGGFTIPWITLLLSVVLFVVVPLIAASTTRNWIIKKKGKEAFETRLLARLKPVTTIGLLLTLVIIFTMQADLIIANPLHILLISVPLMIQTFLIFTIAYVGAKWLRLPHNIAAPAGMIGASNFFELAVAVAIALFPLNPGVALATIVGVLTEVPIMLLLVTIANRTKRWFH